MFEVPAEEIEKHPYLSIFFFASVAILFTLFMILTALNVIPAGFGIGTLLLGQGIGSAIVDWGISTLFAAFISADLSAFFTILIDMISTEIRSRTTEVEDNYDYEETARAQADHLREHTQESNPVATTRQFSSSDSDSLDDSSDDSNDDYMHMPITSQPYSP